MTLFIKDPTLLDGFRQGKPQALEKVYWEYINAVDSVIRGGIIVSSGARVMGASQYQDRMDLIQETFTRAFSDNARNAYDGIRKYRPYLLTIARNLLADYSRKRNREIPTEALESISDNHSATDPPEVTWADPATMELVRDYLKNLPEDLVAVHQQRFIEGVTQKQAAQNLGLTRQKVRTKENRLIKGLRRTLKQHQLSQTLKKA